MRLLNRVVILAVTMLFMLMAGCHNKVYQQSQGNIADVVDRSKQAIKKSDQDAKPMPSLVVKPGLYVDQTPVDLAKQPTWLKNYIIIRGEDLPFSYYSRVIVNGGDQSGRIARAYQDYKGSSAIPTVEIKSAQSQNVLTRYQIGLDPTLKLSLNYSGTVKGALDLIASKTGYVYSVNGNDVYWQAFVTKTFDIAFMPGTSDYMMGKSSGGSGASGATATAGGSSTSGNGGSMTMAGGFMDDSSGSQYSSLKGSLSVWKDLDTTIKQLLSPDGKVIVSEATTSVTVRDRPSNLSLVSKYIANLNQKLSTQVLIKVEVLEISLSDDFSFGINWQAVQKNLGKGTYFTVSADSSAPIAISSLTAGAASPTIGFQPSGSSYIAPLITALQQQGRVSVVTEPRVVSLNNQVSAIRIVNQAGYLASLQLTSFGSTNSSPTLQNQVTTQVTPGTVVTGLTLYVLPKILGKKVYLQVNADLSTNNGFDSISSTGQTSTADNPQPTIQVPNISQKQFNQRSVIASGDTMVLSGFKQLLNRANTQEVLNSADLGGRAARQQNIETIVLITPVVLHGCA